MAALALPGVGAAPAKADPGDAASFQYGQYKQSSWQLLDGLKSQYSPLQVNNIQGTGDITLRERWKLGFHYQQDTWSGATPVASAPNALGGNNPTVSGASPLIQGNSTLLYDSNLNPYRLDQQTAEYVQDKRLVQTIASASPEIRNQGDFQVAYAWDEAAVNLGGGFSEEPDYHSSFLNLGGRIDLNQKLTTLDFGVNYSNSSISARISPSFAPYINTSAYTSQIVTEGGPWGFTNETLTGTRQDWAPQFTLSQVVNKQLLVKTSLGYIRNSGYLANPYKAVDFVYVDFDQPVDVGQTNVPTLYQTSVEAALEKRPNIRNQGIWDIRAIQYVEPLDASFRLGYRLFADDWGITAHTFDLDWVQPVVDEWTVIPRFRYYSQNGAYFYQPYFLFQGTPPGGNQFNLSDVPLKAYSSDYRLSAYGAISAGLTVTKNIGKAVQLEAGFEYYTHQGDLRMGGDGPGNWSNFSYYQFNSAIRVNLSAISQAFAESGDASHEHHHGHHHQHAGHLGMNAPAGVMYNHTLSKAGEAMVGYRYAFTLQQGSMSHKTSSASDAEIIANGCGSGIECSFAASNMSMNMNMLNLMYAPVDWLTLMVMPQFMAMDMNLRVPVGAPLPDPSNPHAAHGASARHVTGGAGDIGMFGLFKLFQMPGHELVGSIGFSAPTGSVSQKIAGNSQYEHYMMQLGAGVWNIIPAMTYNGMNDQLYWGGQVSGVAKLQNRNESGFSFGNQIQVTSWAGYQLLDWLSASLRGAYTLQGAIQGQYPDSFSITSPMDNTKSYGGQYWDIGMGLNAEVKNGSFMGNRFGVEWLQPVHTYYNGYQLERTGSLFATWSYSF